MRRKARKIVQIAMAVVMAGSMMIGNVVTTKAASSKDVYDKGYGISTILSRWQFFVKGDADISNHQIGGVVVGGTYTSTNTFGDSQIYPSYIGTWKNGSFGNGTFFDQNREKNKVVYYGTTAVSSVDAECVQNPGYMNLTDAFDKIEKQSAALVSGADKLGAANGSISVNISETKDYVNVEIPYSVYKNTPVIDLKMNHVDRLKDKVCVISVTGVNASDVAFDFTYSNVRFNGTGFSNALEKMTDIEDKQYSSKGMNLVFNFPDATGTLSFQGLSGHVVAPKANVVLGGGNYEGGVIAKNLSASAQGHFYPMNKELKGADTSATTEATTKATTEATTKATTEATTKATTEATTKATTEATTKATTEATTKATTEATTKATTEATTKATTEATTKATTEATTKATTEATTKATTEATTEATTKATTEATTKATEDGTTEATTEATTETPTPTTEVTPNDENHKNDEGKGNLIVTVVDEKTDEVVPNAEVTVRYPDGTEESRTTDSEGKIALKNTATGTYTITVSKVPDGYTVSTQTSYTVNVMENETTSAQFKVGTATATTTEAETEDEDDDDDDDEDDDDSSSTQTQTQTSKTAGHFAKTGDQSPVVPAMVVMMVSAIAFIGILVIRRKK